MVISRTYSVLRLLPIHFRIHNWHPGIRGHVFSSVLYGLWWYETFRMNVRIGYRRQTIETKVLPRVVRDCHSPSDMDLSHFYILITKYDSWTKGRSSHLNTICDPSPTDTLDVGQYWNAWLRFLEGTICCKVHTPVLVSRVGHLEVTLSWSLEHGPKRVWSEVRGKGKRLKQNIGKWRYSVSTLILIYDSEHTGGSFSDLDSHRNPWELCKGKGQGWGS